MTELCIRMRSCDNCFLPNLGTLLRISRPALWVQTTGSAQVAVCSWSSPTLRPRTGSKGPWLQPLCTNRDYRVSRESVPVVGGAEKCERGRVNPLPAGLLTGLPGTVRLNFLINTFMTRSLLFWYHFSKRIMLPTRCFFCLLVLMELRQAGLTGNLKYIIQ